MKTKGSVQGYVKCVHTLLDSDFIDSWDCSPRYQIAEDIEICMTYIVQLMHNS